MYGGFNVCFPATLAAHLHEPQSVEIVCVTVVENTPVCLPEWTSFNLFTLVLSSHSRYFSQGKDCTKPPQKFALVQNSTGSLVFLPFLKTVAVKLNQAQFWLNTCPTFQLWLQDPHHHCQCLQLEHLHQRKCTGWRPCAQCFTRRLSLPTGFAERKTSHAQNMTPAAPASHFATLEGFAIGCVGCDNKTNLKYIGCFSFHMPCIAIQPLVQWITLDWKQLAGID